MTAREFLEYADIKVAVHTLHALTQYLHGSNYDFGIDYRQLPDGTVGNLSEDMGEPVGFQECVELYETLF